MKCNCAMKYIFAHLLKKKTQLILAFGLFDIWSCLIDTNLISRH